MPFICYRKSDLEIVSFSGSVPAGYTGEQEIMKNVLPNFGGELDDYSYIEINEVTERSRIGRECSLIQEGEQIKFIVGDVIKTPEPLEPEDIQTQIQGLQMALAELTILLAGGEA